MIFVNKPGYLNAMLTLKVEKTEGPTKNGQSRDTDNIGHMTQNEDTQNNNVENLTDKQYVDRYGWILKPSHNWNKKWSLSY